MTSSSSPSSLSTVQSVESFLICCPALGVSCPNEFLGDLREVMTPNWGSSGGLRLRGADGGVERLCDRFSFRTVVRRLPVTICRGAVR